MADEKHKMQADGSGAGPGRTDKDKEIASRQSGQNLAGESAGGPYPNPHSGKDEGAKTGEFKGGQSNQAYYGKGQLGEKDVGETENAPSSRK